MHTANKYIESIRMVAAGFLLVFSIATLRELSHNTVFLIIGIIVSLLAILFARYTARHFHGHHHHAGDSVHDVAAVTVLFMANILHPAVDGFSLFETFSEGGMVAGVLLMLSVVLHELLRQSALIIVFRQMEIRWYLVVITALIGIALGIGAGVWGTAVFHQYEHVIDCATLFAYVFIIAESYFNMKGERVSKAPFVFGVLGICIGIVITFFVHSH